MKNFYIFLLALTLTGVAAQTIDSVAIKQVDSLIKVSRALTEKNDFDKAFEVNAVAEKIALEKLRKESAAYGSSCFNRGRIAYYKNDYPEAEKWYLESKDIREKYLGKAHPDYVATLNNLASLYVKMLKYEKAELLYIEANAIREKVLGKEHPDYAGNLINLALLYDGMGQFEKVEPLYLKAKEIFEGSNNLKHPYYINCLNNLATLYHSMGQFEKAEPLYLESIAIGEKTEGKEHPDYASKLDNLAALYYDMGQYEKAEALLLKSKAIREKALGKEHPDYASSLNNLAALYYGMGQYEKAEPLYLESIAIGKKTLGKEHLDYAGRLNNLAVLYTDMDQYEKAEPLYLEAKAIREKALGKEHPDYASCLNNLASLYTDMDQYKKAEPLFLEAKAIREKVLGKEHPDYASSLNNLANLYDHMDQYEKAEPIYLEAIAIHEKALGKGHPLYAMSLNDLANLYYNMGQYEKAEPLYLESKAIKEKALGKEHPDYPASLYNLAILYKDMGQYEKAEPLYIELSSVNKLLIERAMHHLSEKELNAYMKQFSQSLGQTFSITQNVHSKEMISVCYDNILFYKGFLLQVAGQLKRIALANPATAENFNLLKSYERRLAAHYASPIAERDSANVAELETKANDLEKDLVRTVAVFGEATRQATWQEVQQKLRAGEAAAEFVQYRFARKKQTDSTMYAALLLLPGALQPKFIPLFEEKSLDSLLHSKSDRKADYVNSLYTLADRGAVAIETPKKSLYEILWKPLEEELRGIKTIYFSPSGLLHRINLDAIPISETETLAERYNLIELNSTRQLVIPTQVKIARNDAVLFGGIKYEHDSTFQNGELPIDIGIVSRSRGALSFNYVDSTLRGGTWNYLGGTEREVKTIDKIMQTSGLNVDLKKGYNATEESFKKIGTNNSPSPRILHLATHGYFFPDPKESRQSTVVSHQEESVFKMSEHPMLRSGLIMAGGNAAWKGKQTLEGREDGILTAYEISQMNLSNTELVVLSACETGLGDIQGNEGVYGLQRAFKIAGAKYLIMSLWQVPDKQTSLLMTTFYKKWLEDKMMIPEAFHAAQKELREVGLDPYQWAGFVLVE
jgi:CHAT domain-containing protein